MSDDPWPENIETMEKDRFDSICEYFLIQSLRNKNEVIQVKIIFAHTWITLLCS